MVGAAVAMAPGGGGVAVEGGVGGPTQATSSAPNGKAIAVLLPVEDDEELERLILAYSKQFQRLLTVARQSIAQGKGRAHDDFWKEIGDEG